MVVAEGEQVVDEGDESGEGEGDEVQEQAPPPPVLPLPRWLQKALGFGSSNLGKAGAIPWSAQALEEGCGGDTPLFSALSKAHLTLKWVLRRLLRTLIRKNGDGKGGWNRDAGRGGAWVWTPVPGGPMCPAGEQVCTGSLGALNLLDDPRGIRFGNAHYLVCLTHWVALGWCRQWRQGKSVYFAPNWPTLLALPNPIYDPGAQHTCEGLVAGSRGTNKGVAAVVRQPKTTRTPTADPVEAPTASAAFRAAMGAVQAQGGPGFGEVCV